MNEKYNISIVLFDDRRINLCLDSAYAPKTVAHFVELVKQNFFDGTIFHRVIENFMIQTGGYMIEDNTLMPMPDCPTIEGEFASNGFDGNNLKHELGVIAMARPGDKNGASSQFFLCSATCPWLDGEYAAFGYASDEESKEIILKLSKTETGVLDPRLFTDFPVEIIGVKHIELI